MLPYRQPHVRVVVLHLPLSLPPHWLSEVQDLPETQVPQSGSRAHSSEQQPSWLQPHVGTMMGLQFVVFPLHVTLPKPAGLTEHWPCVPLHVTQLPQ